MFLHFSTFDFHYLFVDSNWLYRHYVNLNITLFRKNVNFNVKDLNAAVKRKTPDDLITYELGIFRLQMKLPDRDKKRNKATLR